MFRLIVTLFGAILFAVYFDIDIGLASFFFVKLNLENTLIQQISFWTDYVPLTLYFFVAVYLIKRIIEKISYREISIVYIFYTVCGATALLIKNILGRERPIFETDSSYQLTNSPNSFQLFESYDWNFASMPSGHAAVSFAMALALSRFFPHYSNVFWILAALIAASRVIMSQHWLSDIFVSVLIVIIVDHLLWRRLNGWFSRGSETV